MYTVKSVSGDPEYVAMKITEFVGEGYELITVDTTAYESKAGIRNESTAFLKLVV